jgi:sugar O-acyltransferase (sialic acid O-acetyltransferase NeuD family)
MKKNKLLVIGCGGHYNSCIEIINENKQFHVVGIIDSDKKKFSKIFANNKVIGTDEDLKKIFLEVKFAFVCIGFIKNVEIRKKIFEKLIKIGYKIPYFVAKNSTLSRDFQISEGSIIHKNVFINKNVIIGKNSIINSGSIIEHDVRIGSNVHLAPGCIVNGNCFIDDDCFIGSGAIIVNNVYVKKGTFIKAGSIIK